MSEPVQLVDIDDLVGRGEIAKRSGARLQTVDTWRRRYPDFPAPMAAISGTPIWSWAVVREWIDKTPRLVGRPARRLAMTLAPLPDRLNRAIRSDDDEDADRLASGTSAGMHNDR